MMHIIFFIRFILAEQSATVDAALFDKERHKQLIEYIQNENLAAALFWHAVVKSFVLIKSLEGIYRLCLRKLCGVLAGLWSMCECMQIYMHEYCNCICACQYLFIICIHSAEQAGIHIWKQLLFFSQFYWSILASTVCLWMCEKVGGKKKGRKKMGTCIQKMYDNVHAIHINFLKMRFYQQSPLLLSEDFLAVHFSHYLEYSCHVLMFCAALWSTFFACHGFVFTR